MQWYKPWRSKKQTNVPASLKANTQVSSQSVSSVSVEAFPLSLSLAGLPASPASVGDFRWRKRQTYPQKQVAPVCRYPDSPTRLRDDAATVQATSGKTYRTDHGDSGWRLVVVLVRVEFLQ